MAHGSMTPRLSCSDSSRGAAAAWRLALPLLQTLLHLHTLTFAFLFLATLILRTITSTSTTPHTTSPFTRHHPALTPLSICFLIPLALDILTTCLYLIFWYACPCSVFLLGLFDQLWVSFRSIIFAVPPIIFTLFIFILALLRLAARPPRRA